MFSCGSADRLASARICYSATSKMTSSSIGIPRGMLATPINQPNRCFLDSKDVSKRVRGSVRDLGLVEDVPGGCYEHSEPDDASSLYRVSPNAPWPQRGRSKPLGFCNGR
jgi:hypothetical protein